MAAFYDVVIIGGGQAGLAGSWHLHKRGIEHLVLERDRVGERWRSERWDSLRFQFPNWALQLPGWRYDGPDPDDFASAAEILTLLGAYADPLRSVLQEHTPVTAVLHADQGWLVQTPYRAVRCRAVVLATGPFQRPLVPALAGGLPPGVVQLHSRDYRNPGQVPGGAVLIAGSGGSGTQIAEELADVGLRVHLAASAHRTLPPATGAATHGGGCVRWARSKPPSPTYPKVCRHPRCCSPGPPAATT